MPSGMSSATAKMNEQMDIFGPPDQHEQVEVRLEFPPPKYRIAFRGITSATDQRTIISEILPPGAATGGHANTLTVGNSKSEDVMEAILRGEIILTYTE